MNCLKDTGVLIFPYFMFQLSNDFQLAALSTIRRRTVQGVLMIRHALESLCLACYSLHEPKPIVYGNIEGSEFINPSDSVKNAAYKFLEENYKTYSDIIKKHKDEINKYYSHANIHSAQNTIRFENNKMTGLMFDNYTDEYIREMLIVIVELIFVSLFLIIDIQNKYPLFNFKDDFKVKLNILLRRKELVVHNSLN